MKPFVALLANRYFWPTKRTKNRHSMLAVLGLSLGVTTLITTLAVMNGLQQGYISTILQVGSGHIRLMSRGFLNPNELVALQNLSGVKSVHSETESQTMVRSFSSDYHSLLIKGYDFSSLKETEKNLFNNQLVLVEGDFPGGNEVLIGEVMAYNWAIGLGDSLEALAMTEGRLEAYEKPLVVSGIFKTGYYDYDASLAFVDLSTALEGFALEKEVYYKILLNNKYKDTALLKILADKFFIGQKVEADSWRHFNSAFFGALRLEKNIMIWLLSLIFAVVAVTIFQGRARDIEERYNEIAIMRAMGATKETIMDIFMLQGLWVGLLGSVLGLVFGLLISHNVTAILAFFETLINNVSLFMQSTQHISLLSGESFYLENGIPVIFYFHENLLIMVLALSSSLLATYLAIKKITVLKPLEALYHN